MADRDPIREAHTQWVKRGWEDAADGMALVTSVIRVQQLMMERIDAVLRPLDLSFARYEVLMLLSFSSTGALPMSKVGSLLQVHPTSATSAVQRLEQQGLVARHRDEADRRLILAHVTPRGRRVGRTATRALNHSVFGRLGMTPAEISGLMEGLTRFRAVSGDFID